MLKSHQLEEERTWRRHQWLLRLGRHRLQLGRQIRPWRQLLYLRRQLHLWRQLLLRRRRHRLFQMWCPSGLAPLWEELRGLVNNLAREVRRRVVILPAWCRRRGRNQLRKSSLVATRRRLSI
ncbi:hypothetical protein Dimus_038593 [Dionaea muscipula]